jgi:hypothetical protein
MIGVALVLALGPWLTVLGWRTLFPLPYQIPYYLVPGWDVMRAPARFMLLALLGAIPLIALGPHASAPSHGTPHWRRSR